MTSPDTHETVWRDREDGRATGQPFTIILRMRFLLSRRAETEFGISGFGLQIVEYRMWVVESCSHNLDAWL